MNSKFRSIGIISILLLVLLVVSACTSNGSSTGLFSPYVGGSKALDISFLTGSPRSEVFDGGTDDFSIAVEIRNVGEEDLTPNDGYVQISGILAQEFGVSSAELRQRIPEIPGARMSSGTILNGGIEVVSFDGLSYQPTIAGDLTSQRIRATACYNYKTRSTSNICVKENPYDSTTRTDICTVTGQKQVANSGGPIQITRLEQQVGGQTSVRVVMTISHVGSPDDYFFRLNSECDARDGNSDMYRVFVDVRPIVNGQIAARCSGLQEGSGSSGYITLHNGQARDLICTFDLSDLQGSSVTPLNVELSYRYMQSIETPITIRAMSRSQR